MAGLCLLLICTAQPAGKTVLIKNLNAQCSGVRHYLEIISGRQFKNSSHVANGTPM